MLLDIIKFALSIFLISFSIRIISIYLGIKFGKFKNQSLRFYINPKGLILEFVILIIPITLCLCGLRVLSDAEAPTMFRLMGAMFLMSIFTTYAFILKPYVDYSKSRMLFDEENLQADALEKIGLNIPVKIIDKVVYNAIATGALGFSKIILIGKPLYDGLSSEELRGIFYHEVGHIKYRHLLTLYYLNLFLSFLFILSYFFVLPVIKAHTQIDEGLLVALNGGLVLGGLKISLQLLQRKFEYQADTYAAGIVGKETYISALISVDHITKGLLSKGGITHPKLSKRIAHINK